jgi:tetratricopeptide (TPR) repeat protein
MRQALELRPSVVEFGSAPLRGEVDLLRETGEEAILPLAAAVVAGDPVRARDLSKELLDRPLAERDRLLVHRLRALSHAFAGCDFDAAEAELRQVLAADPKDRWARYRMAEIWARSGLGWLRTGRQIGSAEREEDGRRLLARATDLLGELLLEDPDFHMARLQRGEIHFALRDDIGAKADYQYVRERDASVKEAYLREAVLHRLVYVEGGQRANLEAAVAILGRALHLDPNYFDALYELGNVYHHIYDRQDDPSVGRRAAFSEAILHYRRAMAVNPRQKEPRVEWARICLKAAQEAVADPDPRGNGVVRAHQLVARVEAEAADVPDVHRERARLNLREDFDRRSGLSPDEAFAGAAHALEKLAELAPDDPELPKLRSLYHRRRGWSFYLSWIKIADAQKRARARELAAEEWRLALAAWPDDPEHATIRDRLREIDPSFIEDDRRRAEAAYRRGAEAFAEGAFPEAVAAFREASGYFPESGHLRYNLGLALARAGRLDEARDELQQVANGPEGERFPESMFELGKIALARREEATARVWLERHVAAMEKAGRQDEDSVRRAKSLLEPGR